MGGEGSYGTRGTKNNSGYLSILDHACAAGAFDNCFGSIDNPLVNLPTEFAQTVRQRPKCEVAAWKNCPPGRNIR
jgi:hypothetical protein